MQLKFRSIVLCFLFSFFLISCGGLNSQPSSGKYPPFIQAAQQGNITEVEQLLKSGELIGQKTIDNQTALHAAAAEGQDAMVQWLLVHEASPLAEDKDGKTQIDLAKEQGHLQAAQIMIDYLKLMKSQADAFAAGDIGILRILLAEDGRGYMVLHITAQIGNTLLVAEEIKANADVNAQTANGFTPLHKAVLSGKIELVQMLLDAGADVNQTDVYNDTPLYYAIMENNAALVKLFLAAGADPGIRSVFGNETALEFARKQGKPEIIALLEGK